MRLLITIFVISLGYCCVSTQVDNEIWSDDAVVIEAWDDDTEATTIAPVALEDEVGPGRQLAQEWESIECLTSSTKRKGSCASIRECFPRLFPVDPDDFADTPERSKGVYNQNLLKDLIESSGFCKDPNEQLPGSGAQQWDKKICCAVSDPRGNYSLSDSTNATSANDPVFLRKGCGYIKVDRVTLPERIVGGRKAVLGEFPWVVAMMKGGQQFCGASLIDSRNVLTAAEHDIAIIHLDTPVEYSRTVQPVCLHPGNPQYDSGRDVADVAGWGTTSSGGSQSSTLLVVQLPVITQAECSKKYAKANKQIGPGMVCAGKPGKDSCQGDSGGPLVMDSRSQAKQVGIVSWGIGCASYPGVYTRVDKYMKWINKNKQ